MRTVLTSALVAALVTFALEYLAKPTLEVRKQRILRRHQVTDEVLEAFRQFSFEVGGYLAWQSEADLPTARLDEIASLAQVHATTMRGVFALNPVPLSRHKARALELVAQFAEVWLTGIRYGVPHHESMVFAGTRLDRSLDLASDVIESRPWQFRKRARATAWLEQYGDDDPNDDEG